MCTWSCCHDDHSRNNVGLDKSSHGKKLKGSNQYRDGVDIN